jgi:hypothetical protein
MPIPMEKAPIIPDSVWSPQILFQTSCVDGQLVTSAQITLTAGKVDEQGKWTPLHGYNEMVYVPDVTSLDTDLLTLFPQVQAVYDSLIYLIAALNEARKVL